MRVRATTLSMAREIEIPSFGEPGDDTSDSLPDADFFWSGAADDTFAVRTAFERNVAEDFGHLHGHFDQTRV